MTEHPDGKYNYVVECFDRCSRLTWLFPAERAIAGEIADTVSFRYNWELSTLMNSIFEFFSLSYV